MKNEKVCISKSVGIIAVVLVVLTGLVVLMSSLSNKPTSTNTRADASKLTVEGYVADSTGLSCQLRPVPMCPMDMTLVANGAPASGAKWALSSDGAYYKYKCIAQDACVGNNPVTGTYVDKVCKFNAGTSTWGLVDDATNKCNGANAAKGTGCIKADGSTLWNTIQTGATNSDINTRQVGFQADGTTVVNDFWASLDVYTQRVDGDNNCVTTKANCCVNSTDATTVAQAVAKLAAGQKCNVCQSVTSKGVEESTCAGKKGIMVPGSTQLRFLSDAKESVKVCYKYTGNTSAAITMFGDKCEVTLAMNLASNSPYRDTVTYPNWDTDPCGK